MREARIILPYGHQEAQDALEDVLASLFGGYTATTGRGAWVDCGQRLDEPVWIYDIAMSADDFVDDEFDDTWEDMGPDGLEAMCDSIAAGLARDANQVCIYLRHVTGEVKLVRPPIDL